MQDKQQRDKPRIEAMYYLSPLQQGLLFHRITDAGADPYFYQYRYTLKGPFDIEAFERAWQQVVDCHAVLRTAFAWENLDKAVQVVRRHADVRIERHDWTAIPASEHVQKLDALLDRDRTAGIDLLMAPLMRLQLIRVQAAEWILVNSHHHLIVDGWSLALVLKDLLTAYEGQQRGAAVQLSSPRPYRDYIAWLSKRNMNEAESFWRESLAGFQSRTPLSFDGPASGTMPEARPFAEQSRRITETRTAALHALAKRLRLTVNTIVQGAWSLLLHRYSGSTDILFGATVSGRPAELSGSDEMIGLFINTLPVRVAIRQEMPLTDWLRDLQDRNSRLSQYEWTPLADIQRWSEIPNGQPLFDSLVVFESYPAADQDGTFPVTVEALSSGSSRDAYALTSGRNNYPLSLMIEPGIDMQFIVSYQCGRFAHDAMSDLLVRLEALLDNIIASPETRLCDLPLATDAERKQLQAWETANRESLGETTCIHRVVAALAEETPEAIAVITGSERLTRRELDRRANRLAQYLRARGVGADEPVALCFERSLDLVIAIIAVLKAGGAYVPLDPTYPVNRLAHMIEDSGSRLVLSDGKSAEGLSAMAEKLVLVDREAEVIAELSDRAPADTAGPQNLAYIIYTSGSTGRPKGVAVEHRQVAAYVRGVLQRLNVPEGVGMAAVSTVAADLGNTALFGALCSRRPLHVISADHAFDPDAMAAYIDGQGVEVLKIVPSHLSGLLHAEHPEKVLPKRCLILGGEAVRRDLLARIKALAPDCAVVNHYGPTETTVGVLTHLLSSENGGERDIPIGRPLPFARAYVLDAALQLAPAGVPGELYIGGDTVARGYFGQSDKTAERFVPDPFATEPGARAYRTGDRARYRADGAIEFLGRVDHQVKIRGFRIELGEIDARLRAHPAVDEAVTLVREAADGTRQLVSYVTGNSEVDPHALRSDLARQLPDYMVPQTIVRLNAFPLTVNGKLDRAALSEPPMQASLPEPAYVAPSTPAEEILAGIWKDVLQVERVGVHDNFFSLGGDSIRTLQVIARANQKGVKLTPKQLFEHQTVASAAATASMTKTAEQKSLPPAPASASHEGEENGSSPSGESSPVQKSGETPALPLYPLTGLEPAELAPLRKDWDGIEDCYPLSPMQEGMLFHTLMHPGSGIYLMQQFYMWDGRLDRDAFGRAWQCVIDRHPMLRTSFMWTDLKRPLQTVHRNVNAAEVIEDLDWTHLDEEQQRVKMTEVMGQELAAGLDFTRAPLMRMRLVRRGPDRYAIVRSFHHILTDDWCFSLLMMDFLAYYEAFVEGRELKQAAPAPYRDYIAWLQRQDQHAAERFWRNELAGFAAPTPLGIERVDPDQSGAGASVGDVFMELSPDVSVRLKELAQRYQITPNTFLQGAWALLLSRYSGDEQILFGVTVAGRPTELPGIEGIIGLFINTLPLRLTVSPQASLMGWLKHVLAENYRIRQYEYAPLVSIQQWSEIPPGQSLFRSLMVFENAPKDARLGEERADRTVSYDQDRVHTNYPMTVVGYPGDTMGVRLSYDRRLFDHAAVECMAGHLKTLLEAMAANPEAPLHSLPMLGDREIHRMLEEWNHEPEPWAEAQFPALFEAQVVKTPMALAVQCGDQTLTYNGLNRAANRIAHSLLGAGIRTDSIVAVFDERGLALLSMIVGALKAGGAYLPLDPHHPQERLVEVLANSRAQVVLTTDVHADLIASVVARLPEQSRPTVLTVETIERQRPFAENPSLPTANSDQLAYVIYTSGSTGVPKGAMVQSRGMLNHLLSKIPMLALSPSDVIGQTASQCFDISIWQFLTPLLCGARVQIIPDEVVRDPQQLQAEVVARSVTILEVVPSLLAGMLESDGKKLNGLRWLLPTGEALSPELCRKWFARYAQIPLMNAYGPAECSDDVAMACMRESPDDSETRVSIGRPIDRVRLYVVDPQLNLVPAGVAGELCVGGIAVGRGYLHDPARSASAFVPDPYGRESGTRLYRTGDLVRYRTDGTLEFIGRRDHQVKLRGFRIELGEIESRLAQHPDVERCVAMVVEIQPGRRQLAVYVVAGRELTADELRRFLKRTLPDYMIPQAVIFLDVLPLTPNGKIDRKALPKPENDRTVSETQAPATPTEDLVAGIWGEILGMDRVGREDQFFELGGHSLMATQVMSRVRASFKIELPLRSLFDHPTVGEFAAAIGRALADGEQLAAPPLVPMVESAQAPLSFAQQRIWFLSEMDPEKGNYNLPFALRLEGALDRDALERSILEVIRRHKTLRTTFPSSDGAPFQAVVPPETFAMTDEDLSGLPEQEWGEAVRHLAEEEAVRPFSLEGELPIRATLVRTGMEEHVLLVTIHHIAADAWSLALLTEEVATIYAGLDAGKGTDLALNDALADLPVLPVQYADFASWQRRWLQGDVLEREVHYWRQRLGSNPPQLELRTDHPRPDRRTYHGGRVTFQVPSEIAGQLKRLSRRHGATLFMTMLAAFKVFLSRQSGQTDILVGTDVANRNRAETERLIGFFVNLLPLRTDLSGNPSFVSLLERVRDTALGAYAHQDVPFEKIVEALKLVRDTSRNPLVQVLLVLQNVPPPVFQLPGMTVEALEFQHDVSRFDLGLFMEETSEGLEGVWKFSRDLFEPDTIIRMSTQFVTLLSHIGRAPESGIDSFDLLTEKEKESRAMESKQQSDLKLQRLRRIKPKAVNLSQRTLVASRLLSDAHPLPLMFSPAVDDVDLAGWARENRSRLREELLKYGALLFRGFAIRTAGDFESVAEAVCDELFGEYGDLPREKSGRHVYGSTPYPSDKAILFHNESSHMHRWPQRQFFFCQQASVEGGATPLVDCRAMLRGLRPEIRDRLREKQLMYVRNFVPGVDVRWQDFFRTSDKSVVEGLCAENGMDCQWLERDVLRTRQVCKAVIEHSVTGESVFFNQIQLHHVSCLEPAVRESLLSMLDEDSVPRNVYYGDGSPIDDAIVDEIGALYERTAVRFPWQEGDIVMLDNMLVAHARDPFVGPRKIVVAMGDMIGQPMGQSMMI
ncbi:hypothetical protein W02_10480 [Nitrospira sp. KM1]|nr:hypothetical protein W02_10480 [Nitrospira sp. KM1]